jgi:hypothetical protein
MKGNEAEDMAAAERECQDMTERFCYLFKQKFMTGHADHGGDMEAMTPLEILYEARKENLDQFAYIQKAIKKLGGE